MYNSTVPSAGFMRTKKIVTIDSRDRNYAAYAQASNYLVRLPQTYRNVGQVRLVSSSIPNSMYTFSAAQRNTSFQLAIGTGTVTLHVVTISDGMYTKEGLVHELNVQLQAVDPAMSVTLNPVTHRLQFKHTSTQFRLIFLKTVQPASTIQWGLGYFLGFDATGYTSTMATNGSRSLDSVRPIIVQFYDYVLLDLGDLNSMDECTLEDGRGSNVRSAFAKIHLQNAAPYATVHRIEDCHTFNETLLSSPLPKLETLHVRWKTHDGQDVDFNGYEHSFTLELTLLENKFTQASMVQNIGTNNALMGRF